jgi:ELWxxDGT repeat protein
MTSRLHGRLRALFVLALLASVAPVGAQDSVVMVKDIIPGVGSPNILQTTAVGSRVFFEADDGVTGPELWTSDGTAAGTILVKDIRPGTGGSFVSQMTSFQGLLYFRAADLSSTAGELWKSDGTTAGTVQVKDIRPGLPGSLVSGLTPIGTTLFMRADDGTVGMELWKSDGTTAGTVLLKDVRPGPESSQIEQLTRVGSTLFFMADSDGDGGFELWKSNGSAAGTVLVKDVDVETGLAGALLTGAGDTLFFRAADASAGTELWKSDGTEAGTVRLKDINPGVAASDPSQMTAVGTTLFFVAEDGGGRNLWKSDGTPDGTVRVKVVRPGGGGSLEQLTAVGATLFFAANDGSGRELWKSDGTTAGTVMVKEIVPGGTGASVSVLTNVNGTLYFRANDRITGEELWKSDGTAAGTVLVADINPGLADGTPDHLAAAGTQLFFDADNGLNGRELWRLGPSGPPVLATSQSPIIAGASNTLLGSDFSAGTVVKLFVGTGGGVLSFGPYAITGRTLSSVTFDVPPSVPLGNGVVAIQVIKTDQGFLASNVVGSLLFGDAADNIPTIRNINGQWLGPGLLSYAVAYVEAVVTAGATVTIGGSGFSNALVNVFTAAGNIGPLTPLPGATATQIQVTLPLTAVTGPGNFQVVNNPYTGNVQSQVVAAVINARPSIASVAQVGTTITVNGTGFSTLSVINLFNEQGGGTVNLGGLGSSGARIPLTFVSDTQFTFTRPVAAVAGPAFIEVLNPPYIPYSSSGSDPDGAFSFTAPAPLFTSLGAGGAVAGTADAAAEPGVLAGEPEAEVVTWAGGRSTRALLRGAGFVEWRVGREGTPALGLSHGDTDASLADIDFGLRVDPHTGELVAVERGRVTGAFGTVAAGDVLRVAVRDRTVEYLRNGSLLGTSAARPRYPLLVDSDRRDAGAAGIAARVSGRLGTLVGWPPARGVAAAGTRLTASGTAMLRIAAEEARRVEAGLSRGAGVGFGDRACDYCVVRTGRDVEVWHAGTLRGSFAADPMARVRVEVTAGRVAYWAGATRLDEAALAGERPAHVVAVFGAGGGVLDTATVSGAARR